MSVRHTSFVLGCIAVAPRWHKMSSPEQDAFVDRAMREFTPKEISEALPTLSEIDKCRDIVEYFKIFFD